MSELSQTAILNAKRYAICCETLATVTSPPSVPYTSRLGSSGQNATHLTVTATHEARHQHSLLVPTLQDKEGKILKIVGACTNQTASDARSMVCRQSFIAKSQILTRLSLPLNRWHTQSTADDQTASKGTATRTAQRTSSRSVVHPGRQPPQEPRKSVRCTSRPMRSCPCSRRHAGHSINGGKDRGGQGLSTRCLVALHLVGVDSPVVRRREEGVAVHRVDEAADWLGVA